MTSVDRREEEEEQGEGGNSPKPPSHPPCPHSTAPPHSRLFSGTWTSELEVYTVPLPSTRKTEEDTDRPGQKGKASEKGSASSSHLSSEASCQYPNNPF